MPPALTKTIGYPRIGDNRQLKRALEGYWNGTVTQSQLLAASDEIFLSAVQDQSCRGIDIIGVGSHTLYDHVLDWISRLGIYSKRFRDLESEFTNLEVYFAAARGHEKVLPLDMTKWFDTNYHYLSTELSFENFPAIPNFAGFLGHLRVAGDRVGIHRIGAEILGPLTLVALCQLVSPMTREEAVNNLVPAYRSLIRECKHLGVAEVQLQEPILVLDEVQTDASIDLLIEVLKEFSKVEVPVNLVTFYDDLGEAFKRIPELPCLSSLSLDFTRGNNLELLKTHGWPKNLGMGIGVVDGRNVWSDEVNGKAILAEIWKIFKANFGTEDWPQISIQPSCSLMHLPMDIEAEREIPQDIKCRLHFARQKLDIVRRLADFWNDLGDSSPLDSIIPKREEEDEELDPSLLNRVLPYIERRPLQLKSLENRKFPVTTIGSFPQTPELRKARRMHRYGELDHSQYMRFLDDYLSFCIGVQEGLGLDVFVHGEPERSDMVEYFAERLDGFVFTVDGWVQSYGSRYVRPPIIIDDIARRGNRPMTAREFIVAQSRTKRPVKGMLTGPVTILAWSFPRVEVSQRVQAYQIARALRAEISDLELAGCEIVQVDEPALREALPLRHARRQEYLNWAVNSFKIATSAARPTTHLASHFCYSEFGEVMDAIVALDADMVAIEDSRSEGNNLKELCRVGYPRDMGLGVYDVHSPLIPTEESIFQKLKAEADCGIDPGRFWVVPDCGLKTRKWEEVIPSLRNMVAAATRMRSELEKQQPNE